MNPDQTAPKGAVWSGLILLAVEEEGVEYMRKRLKSKMLDCIIMVQQFMSFQWI